MSNYPLTVMKAPTEKEEDLQKKRYFLDPAPDTTPEEVRSDRLAHLFLMGLKAIKSRKGESPDV
jgi:hypothetical protein